MEHKTHVPNHQPGIFINWTTGRRLMPRSPLRSGPWNHGSLVEMPDLPRFPRGSTQKNLQKKLEVVLGFLTIH